MRRAAQYGALAVKLAFEKMSLWARTPFLNPSERMDALLEAEEAMGRTLAEALGEMRGAAAKLGQTLALESGLLPARFRDRLFALQHAAAPMSYASVRKVIKASFQRPPEELFREFEPEAFAAASLGQVHRATLETGERVAVKVQYPGVAESIESDFSIVRALLAPLAENGLVARTFAELHARIADETDYAREKENQIWFRERGATLGVRIPKVHESLCSRCVLTTELLDGVPLSDRTRQVPEAERDRIGQSIFDFFAGTLFLRGAIHGDPHGGNYLRLASDERLGVVDFGAAKRDFRPEALEVFRGFFGSPNPDRTISLYQKLGADLGAMSLSERHAFYDEVVEPYRAALAALTSEESYEFKPDDGLARELRLHLVSHAFHPRLQSLSSEFTTLHRSLFGALGLLATLGCRISPRIPSTSP